MLKFIEKCKMFPGGFWWCSLLIMVLLAMPCIGGKQGVPDGLYQALCILVLFPLIVLTGAGSVTKGARSTAICRWLGNISYPIYITHYPLMYMQMNWVAEHQDAPLWQHIARFSRNRLHVHRRGLRPFQGI